MEKGKKIALGIIAIIFLVAIFAAALMTLGVFGFGSGAYALTPNDNAVKQKVKGFLSSVSGLPLIGSHLDTDNDYVTNHLEVFKYKTNPFSADTDGDGIDDFNEIYTYPHLLDPNNPDDAEEFMKMIPNVEAKAWRLDAGGVESPIKILEISKRDPLVQWYANHIKIDWNTTKSDSWGHTYDDNIRIGELKINREPFWLGTPEWYASPIPVSEEIDHAYPHPAYFLTHGRKGACGDTASVLNVILELKGYDSIELGANHGWVETHIDGEIYVADFNKLVPREKFYEENKGYMWEKGKNYDPDWYEKGLETFQKKHFLPAIS